MARTPHVGARGNGPDLLAGAFFIGVGALGLWAGRSLPMGTAASMGPGYLPLAVSLFVMAIGLVVTAMSLISAREPIGLIRLRPVLIISVAVVGFAYLAELSGFIIASVWLIGVAGLADRDTRPVELLVSIVALTAFAVVVFILGLGVQIRLWPS